MRSSYEKSHELGGGMEVLYQQNTNETVVQNPLNHQLPAFELKECLRENY